MNVLIFKEVHLFQRVNIPKHKNMIIALVCFFIYI